MNEDECVANGIALLDKRVPGWRAKIDVDKIDLTTRDNCILGQVYREEAGHGHRTGYGIGITMLDLKDKTGIFNGHLFGLADVISNHGFDVCETDSSKYAEAYPRLTNAWKRALTKEQTS